jgi:NADH-quinone oxidoreductase subunit N
MAGVAIAIVFADFFIADKRALTYMAAAGLAVPLLFSLNLWFNWFGDTSAQTALFGSLSADRFALFFQFLLLGITAAVIVASVKYVERLRGFEGEFLALVLFAVTGMLVLVSARELISIYVALELTALPAAALAAFRRDNFSIEAGLKFIILSAVSSAVLLYGIVFIYGYTGSTNLEVILTRLSDLPVNSGEPFGSYAVLFAVVMIVAGFAFKMAIVPWHMWVPDVYQGSPTPVAAFLSTASKASAFAVVIRIMYSAFGSEDLARDWSELFAALAVASMVVGNLLALGQNDIKRLLGYSTITQAGYILIGVAAVSANADSGSPMAGPQGVMYYLAGYAFTNLAVFFAVIGITARTGSNEISSLNGLGRRSPVLAMLLTVGLLSLLGMPPTVGFMSKVVVFGAAVNSGLLWLAVVGVVNTVVSAFYYLRVIRAMFFEEAEDESRITADAPVLFATSLAAVGVGLFGAVPWLILNLAEKSLDIL